MSNLNKTVKSSFLLIIESVSKKMVGLVSTLILARVLTPEDFGIVAIATLAFGFLDVFAQTGSKQYIHTVTDINERVINTAFTYNLIIKVIIAILFALLTPYVADYYDDPRLIPVLYVFSLMLAVQGLTNPQVYVLQREQNYSKIVTMIVIAKVISVIVAITVALSTESYWALVGGQFFAYSLPVIGGYIIAPYRPRLTLVNIKAQFSYAGWLIPVSIFRYARSQMDTILISRIFDATVLGSYHVMKYLSLFPSMHLIGPMTEPLLAQLASVKDNKEYFSKLFNVSLLVALIIALPFSNLMFFYADVIIETVLGDQWVSYSNLFSLFSLLVVFSAIFQHGNRCFLIFAQTKMSFYFELCALAVVALVLLTSTFETPRDFAFTKISIEIGFALAILAYTSILYTTLKRFFSAALLIICMVGISSISLYLPDHFLGHPDHIFEFILLAIVYVFLYVVLLVVAAFLLKRWFDEMDYLWNLLFQYVSKNYAL